MLIKEEHIGLDGSLLAQSNIGLVVIEVDVLDAVRPKRFFSEGDEVIAVGGGGWVTVRRVAVFPVLYVSLATR